MRKGLEIGGVVATVVLIAFGVAAIVMGANGKSTVQNSLSQEQIVGTPDMTPTEIKGEVAGAGLTNKITDLPSCSVAEEAIDNGDKARCFAQYMRIHALLATGGYTYSQMGRFEALPKTPKSELAPGGGTENEKLAVTDPETKLPVENGARQTWVTETALSTALNASYMADRLSIFGIVIGIALLLTGIGFGVLVVGGAVRNPDTALEFLHLKPQPTS
jgi:F0F1-type ATP synthase membrane subunit c/vacuolar-type H+-ATPase subunit K